MISKLKNLEKLINSELSSKIQSSSINNDELLVEIGEVDLIFFSISFLNTSKSKWNSNNILVASPSVSLKIPKSKCSTHR